MKLQSAVGILINIKILDGTFFVSLQCHENYSIFLQTENPLEAHGEKLL